MPSTSRPARTSGALDAAAGAIAAAVALAVGELVSALDGSGASLVTAVGDEFVDRFAASLKDLAVALFGTNDKIALVVGIVVVSAIAGAAVGTTARRRPWIVPLAFGAFGAVGFAAYQRAPLTDAAVGAVAALMAAASGSVSLWFLLRLSSRGAAPASAASEEPDDGVAAGAGIAARPRAAGGPADGAPRRAFLAGAAVLGAGAAGSALLARRARGPDPAAELRRTTTLPEPVATTPVPRQPFDQTGLSPYVTPNGEFYRIDTALSVPRVDPGEWRLHVRGLVDEPFSLDFDELLALESVVEPVTLQCVSNEIGGDLVGNAVWQGVPLTELLDRARVRPDGTQVLGRSVDGFTAGFPTDVARDGRTALVAYAMNGELLPTRHGFPARLVVAGLYGYVSATKWLSEIELTRFDEVDGYWIPRGWAKEGPVKTASRIDVPRAGATVAPGPTAIAGVAWSGARGISAVEVQVDDGPWQACRLGEVASDETWVQWRLAWDASPGEHVLAVRATDGDGAVQTSQVSDPAPDGATGLHARRVRVEA